MYWLMLSRQKILLKVLPQKLNFTLYLKSLHLLDFVVFSLFMLIVR